MLKLQIKALDLKSGRLNSGRRLQKLIPSHLEKNECGLSLVGTKSQLRNMLQSVDNEQWLGVG